jgi:putative phosphoribosyl transferase
MYISLNYLIFFVAFLLALELAFLENVLCMIYKDRKQAGIFLGEKLKSFNYKNPYIFGITHGGVVIAAEAAKVLGCPFAAVVARKLHTLSNEELAFGAIAGSDIEVFNYDLVRTLGLDPSSISKIETREKSKLIKQSQELSPKFEELKLKGKTVILVDDGVATGLTAIAALRYLRTFDPKKLVFGTPVCSDGWEESMQNEADEYVCLFTLNNFLAVGQFYRYFNPVSDQEVSEILIRGSV